MIPLNFVPKELSPAEFKKIATFIEKNVGIKTPPEKRLMMQSRLSARLKALKMNSSIMFFQEGLIAMRSS